MTFQQDTPQTLFRFTDFSDLDRSASFYARSDNDESFDQCSDVNLTQLTRGNNGRVPPIQSRECGSTASLREKGTLPKANSDGKAHTNLSRDDHAESFFHLQRVVQHWAEQGIRALNSHDGNTLKKALAALDSCGNEYVRLSAIYYQHLGRNARENKIIDENIAAILVAIDWAYSGLVSGTLHEENQLNMPASMRRKAVNSQIHWERAYRYEDS